MARLRRQMNVDEFDIDEASRLIDQIPDKRVRGDAWSKVWQSVAAALDDPLLAYSPSYNGRLSEESEARLR